MDWLRKICELADTATHGKRFKGSDGKWGYRPIKGAISENALLKHLDGDEESLAIYLNHPHIKGGKCEMSHFLILDFDDHAEEINPDVMIIRVGAVSGVLLNYKIPHFVVRSGGGKGYHIWMVFEDARRTDTIRDGAQEILNKATNLLHRFWSNERFVGTTKGGKMFHRPKTTPSKGMTSDSDIKEHHVEMIPKGTGKHLIALPLGRQSILMKTELGDDGFAIISPHPSPETFQFAYVKKQKPGPKSAADKKEVNADAAFDALTSRFDVNDYADWVKVTMRMIATFGADDAWAKSKWITWSKTGNWKSGDEKKWDECRNTRLSKITFWRDAQSAGYEGKIPFDKSEVRKLTAIKYLDDIALLRDEVGISYAQVDERHFVPVKSEAFKGIVARGIYRSEGEPADDSHLKAVITLADALAQGEPRQSINLRFAQHEEKRYLFLADDKFTVIEIDSEGWRLSENPPVIFRKGDSQPLPIPEPGGIKEFINFLNIDLENVCFVFAWMLNALCAPAKQCPLLLIDGVAGSCKTSVLKTIVTTLDPKVGAQAGPPASEDDLISAAYSSATVSFDNASTLGNLSDALCRLSTGGGVRKRKLYTDGEAFSLDARRPVIVAGIDPTIYQQDLIERVVRIDLIKPETYMNDIEFEQRLEELRPRFTGAILSLASEVLRMLPQVKSENFRFGEFVRYGECASRILGFEPGWFANEFQERIEELAGESADADSVITFLLHYLGQKMDHDGSKFEAKAAYLWEHMQDAINTREITVSRDDTPKNSRVMGSRINRAAGVLKSQYGITIRRGQRREFIFSWNGVDPLTLIDNVHTDDTLPPF